MKDGNDGDNCGIQNEILSKKQNVV